MTTPQVFWPDSAPEVIHFLASRPWELRGESLWASSSTCFLLGRPFAAALLSSQSSLCLQILFGPSWKMTTLSQGYLFLGISPCVACVSHRAHSSQVLPPPMTHSFTCGSLRCFSLEDAAACISCMPSPANTASLATPLFCAKAWFQIWGTQISPLASYPLGISICLNL
jgi:hypothetical protein